MYWLKCYLTFCMKSLFDVSTLVYVEVLKGYSFALVYKFILRNGYLYEYNVCKCYIYNYFLSGSKKNPLVDI
jgi:hypothetical protein